jgi:alanyl-tRNA synthetase
VSGDRLGRAASITCSSTPGSTCCRRRSTGCSRPDRQLSPRRRSATIDLARGDVAGEIARAEEEANRIVWEDRPVTSGSPTRRRPRGCRSARIPRAGHAAPRRGRRLRSLGLRRHARRAHRRDRDHRCVTWERFKGGSRVGFVCGGRALRRYHALRDSVAASIRLLSVLPEELPGAIERLQAEGKERSGRSRLFRASWLGSKEIGWPPRPNSSVRIASCSRRWRDGIRTASRPSRPPSSSRPGHVAVLFGEPSPAAVVIARGEGSAIDCAALLKSLTSRFGGKGGGRPDLAQGGGLRRPTTSSGE